MEGDEMLEDPTNVDFISAELILEQMREWDTRACVLREWRVSARERARIHRMHREAFQRYMAFFNEGD
jgi:beta-xylosidase